jgi:pyridoxine/pyridoxamine 5'-phosphate oxidase
MSLEDLQKVIDVSIAGATAFTRGLFETNRWTAQQLQTYANEDASMTVATVGKDGKPHAAVVIAGCVDGTFYFTASPKSALLGNLRRDPSIAFTISDKAMGRGTARVAGRGYEMQRIGSKTSKLMRDLIEEGWRGYIYEIEVERLFAQQT